MLKSVQAVSYEVNDLPLIHALVFKKCKLIQALGALFCTACVLR